MAGPALDPHLERLIAAFNDHDIERYMAQYTADVTFHGPAAGEADHDELRAEVLDLFAAFPDIRIDPERAIPHDDLTAVEMSFVGTHENAYKGIPPTGERGEVPAVMVARVTPDGVAYRRDYWNMQTFREELGLTVPAVFGHLPRFAWWALRERLGRVASGCRDVQSVATHATGR